MRSANLQITDPAPNSTTRTVHEGEFETHDGTRIRYADSPSRGRYRTSGSDGRIGLTLPSLPSKMAAGLSRGRRRSNVRPQTRNHVVD